MPRYHCKSELGLCLQDNGFMNVQVAQFERQSGSRWTGAALSSYFAASLTARPRIICKRTPSPSFVLPEKFGLEVAILNTVIFRKIILQDPYATKSITGCANNHRNLLYTTAA